MFLNFIYLFIHASSVKILTFEHYDLYFIDAFYNGKNFSIIIIFLKNFVILIFYYIILYYIRYIDKNFILYYIMLVLYYSDMYIYIYIE